MVSDGADDHQQGQDHGDAPVQRAPFLDPQRGGRLEHVGRPHRFRGAVRLVVLADERNRIDADHRRNAPDVPPGVEVAAAGREVVLLDAPDDGFPDPGPVCDLRHGETSLAACLRQGVTDAHAAPPLALS